MTDSKDHGADPLITQPDSNADATAGSAGWVSDPDQTWVMSGYLLSSKTFYHFGPLKGDEAMDEFFDRMDLSGDWSDLHAQRLNDPSTLASGDFVS